MDKMSIILRQNGSVTIIAVLTMLLAGIAFSGVMFASTNESRFSTQNVAAINAQYAAEAGIKRALVCFEDSKAGGSPDWSWLQSSKTTLKNKQLIDSDATVTYSVFIQPATDATFAVLSPVTTAPSTSAQAYYLVTATGTDGTTVRTITFRVTISGPQPSPFQYVIDTVTTAVGQVSSKKWKRDAGKQYNADSWNGIVELLLQEGNAKIDKNWKPKYDGTTDKTQWGSNWHFGYAPKNIAPGTDPKYAPGTTSTNSYHEFINQADFYSVAYNVDTSDSDNNNYSKLKSTLWDGTSTVYAGGNSSLSSYNSSKGLKPYFPPWVLLTSNSDFSSSNIDKIINNTGITADNKLQQLKSVLGSIVVYRNDTTQTGDPTSNPVQIYKINVDMATKKITRSPATNVDFP